MEVVMCEELTFLQRLGEGAGILLLGMVTVFAVLAILWGVLVIFKLAFYDLPLKKANKKSEEKAIANVAVEETANEETADDGAVIAAITVAVGEMLKADGYNGGFRVVSFKKSGKNTAWNKQ